MEVTGGEEKTKEEGGKLQSALLQDPAGSVSWPVSGSEARKGRVAKEGEFRCGLCLAPPSRSPLTAEGKEESRLQASTLLLLGLTGAFISPQVSLGLHPGGVSLEAG